MIFFKNVQDIHGRLFTLTIDSSEEKVWDGTGLTVLPALIDPHVHFRVPGGEHKEDWMSGARAAISGGVTTVFDMPNNVPPCITRQRLHEKKAVIDGQLKQADIPLRYQLYFGADKTELHEIPKVKGEVAGLKIFMGSSTGTLLIDDDTSLFNAFQAAAKHQMVVAVHAEDEAIIQQNKQKYQASATAATHSLIRSPDAAISAVAKAIDLAEKTGARLYILHVSTKGEVELIRQAKKKGLDIFAETTPHHLFCHDNAYASWGCYVKVNPPLRSIEDQEALWEGIKDGTFDTIGSDHAPHTRVEKEQSYSHAPAGVPGVETTLPLLLNAYHQGRLSLEKIVSLTRTNIERLFSLESNNDWVLVDLNRQQSIEFHHLHTKCGWSPFNGLSLRGWPIYTIMKQRVYHVV